MRRSMLLGKIHRATITGADLEYEGSITIDADLLDAVGILEHEEVHVWDVTNGARLITYTLRGPRGSGVVCINGAAAHQVETGDTVIIACFIELEDEEARTWQPNIILVDSYNKIREARQERLPGSQAASSLSRL